MSEELTDRDMEGGSGKSGWSDQETDRFSAEPDNGGDQAGDVGGKATFMCLAFALEGAGAGAGLATAYNMAMPDNGWDVRTLLGGGAAVGGAAMLAIFVPIARSMARQSRGSGLVVLGCVGTVGAMMSAGLTLALLAITPTKADDATRAWIPAAVENARSLVFAGTGPGGIKLSGAPALQLQRPFLNCGKGLISASALSPASAPSGMEAVTATLRREGCDKLAVSTTTWTLTRGIPGIIPGSLEIEGYVLKVEQDRAATGGKP